jgi:uncharacterized repeat protein (TIGR03806 family)
MSARAPREFRSVLLAVVCQGLLGACQVDEPHPIPAPGSTIPVDRLSQLGIFVGDPAEQVPRSDFIAYDVNVSLYADGAFKHRFLYLPPATKIHAAGDRWEIPVGSYFVKTFFFPVDARDPSLGNKLIETRFLVRTSDGYTMSTYLWNDDQRDAVVSGGNVNVPISWIDAQGVEHNDHFHVPGTSQCPTCHQNRALGLRSRQMDLVQSYPDGTSNQVEHLVALGILDGPPPARDPLVDPFGKAPLEDRARSYLDANCGHCHAPDQGISSGTGVFWNRESTDATHLPICRSTTSIDGRDRVIVPGRPQESEFISRMLSSDPFVRMPQGPTHVPDGAAIAVLSQWVASLTPAGCR